MLVVLTHNKNVVTGLEGCGKSSRVFQYLCLYCTPERPILFGVKNYLLMTEQIKNWSDRFGIDEKEFCIAGRSLNYEPARLAYTNPETPWVIPDGARFIFCTQASIQRNLHWTFIKNSGGKRKEIIYSHIVIDEFDYLSGIIPTLDYELSNMRDCSIREITETQKLKWVKSNYTQEDYYEIQNSGVFNQKGFSIAYWIQDCERRNCPLTFLTSEVLATTTLQAIGFHKIDLESTMGLGTETKFEDNIVRIWTHHTVGKNFFNAMNNQIAWNKLDAYDLVISDCVLPYFSQNAQSLEVSVINHTSIRGSNSHRDKAILTVLSYIPTQHLVEVRDCLEYFNNPFSFESVERLFYRDRLCQAIGRVLGYRGSKETDVITHPCIYDLVRKEGTFPYTLVDWDFDFPGITQVLSRASVLKSKNKELKRSRERAKRVKDLSYLDNFFIKSPKGKVPVSLCKTTLSKSGFSTVATKVAKYFDCEVVYRMIKGKSTRCISGLDLKPFLSNHLD